MVEGTGAVSAALAAEALIELWVSDAALNDFAEVVDLASGAGVLVVRMSDSVSAAVSATTNPMGLLGVAAKPQVSLTALLASSPRRLVVVDLLNDPGNAGTIIRTADAAGCDGVIFTAGSVDPYNEKCVRATAGSIFGPTIVTGVQGSDTIDAVQKAGITVIATSATAPLFLGAPSVRELFAGSIAWLFGNEAQGLPSELQRQADLVVAIPIIGTAESLNVAMAAGLCMYADVLCESDG